MKITRVVATPVQLKIDVVPYATEGAGTKFHWGGKRSRVTPKRPAPVMEYVLVRLETNAGVTGIGEAAADIGFFGYTVEQVRYAIEDYLGPQWVGKDPFDREYLLGLIDFRENHSAVCGLDLALHDLIGKALQTPVSVLIGGRHKQTVPVSIEIPGGTAEGMANGCAAYMEKGVRAFKTKIGGIPDDDAERLRAIRQTVGRDVSLRADANQGYSPKEAIRLCRLAEKYDVGLDLLEQPVAKEDLQGMAFVRRSVDTLIEADESCFTPSDAMQIIRHDAADVLNIKLNKAGGLYRAKKMAALAEAAGLKCVMGTSWGLGVEVAAKLHLASSTMTVTDEVEFTELGLHGNMLSAPHDRQLALPLENGCLPVPDGPGFGVTVSEPPITNH